MTDPTEELITCLRPATPSADLMARLRAAKPKRHSGFRISDFRFQFRGISLPWRRVALIGGLGSAAALVVASHWTDPRRDTRIVGEPVGAPMVAEPTPPEGSQIFLPVESTRTLVSLQPTRVIQLPDQAPQRFVRAVWVDDVTAVGAETEAALHVRRAHEAYLPVSSPIY